MKKPDVNRLWETYVKIDPEESLINIIRSKLYPMLNNFKNNNIAAWCCFLVGKSRVKNDPNLYFHIRLEPNEEIHDREQVNQILPDFCEKKMTALCKNVEDTENIPGINKSLLRNDDIAEAWKILGEQSEWLMNLVNGYKDDTEIPIGQITQFMHFYLNMLGIGGHAVLYFGPVFQF